MGEFFEPNLQGAMIERRTQDCQLLYDPLLMRFEAGSSEFSLIGCDFATARLKLEL
jgi:hypothetical protein